MKRGSSKLPEPKNINGHNLEENDPDDLSILDLPDDWDEDDDYDMDDDDPDDLYW